MKGKRKEAIRRFWALLLAFAMIFTSSGMSVLAEEAAEAKVESVKSSNEDAEKAAAEKAAAEKAAAEKAAAEKAAAEKAAAEKAAAEAAAAEKAAAEKAAAEAAAKAESEKAAAEAAAKAESEKAAAEAAAKAESEKAAAEAAAKAESEKAAAEAAAKAESEKATETLPENTTEPATESVTEIQTEPVSEIVTEAVTEAQTEIVTEAVTESETEEVTEKETEVKTSASFSFEGGNVKAQAELSKEIPEDARFVTELKGADSSYYNDALSQAKAWAAANGLEVTDALVFDMHFEKDGKVYEVKENAKVTLTFAAPVLAGEGSVKVLHLSNGIQDVTGAVSQNEDGSVNSVSLNTNGFSPFVMIKAAAFTEETEAAELDAVNAPQSTVLNQFITSAEVRNGVYEGDKLVLHPGSVYSFKLTFEENFEKVLFDKEMELTYTFPKELTPIPGDSGTFEMKVDVGGTTYTVSGNTYEVQGNTVKVNFNKEDPNFQHLKDATNAEFFVLLSTKVDENATGDRITFGDTVSIPVKFDTSAELDVDKQGSYDKNSGKFKYEIHVKSTGSCSNVKVTDEITGTLLTYAKDFKAVSSMERELNGAYTEKENGFEYVIDSMSDGEVITITYTADVDYSQLSGNKFTADETRNTVTAESDNGGKHSDSKDFENTTAFDNISKSNGTLGETVNGEQIIDWSITVNGDAKKAVGGSKVKDTIQSNERVPMTYAGEGITVTVYGADGSLVRTYDVLWDSMEKTDQSWTYTLPESDTTPYKYVISYKTKADVSKVLDQTSLQNSAQFDEGDSSTGSVTIEPQSTFGVTKHHSRATKESVDWTVTVDIPKTGFNESFVITDTLPGGWYDSKWYADTYIEESMEIQLNEKPVDSSKYDLIYTAPTTGSNGKVSISFKEVEEIFKAADKNSSLVLTYKTKPAQDWPSAQEHRNTVQVTADGTSRYADDSYRIAEQKIDKKAGGQGKVNGLPIFRFEIYLEGVNSDSVTVADQFDTSLFKIYMPENDPYKYPQVGAGAANYEASNGANGSSNGGQLSVKDTDNGCEFTVVPAKKEGGAYYNWYCISYNLIVKDEAALKKLQEMAVANGGTAEVANTASWEGISTEKISTEYTFNPLEKSVSTEAGNWNNYTATYTLTINPNKAKLNGGNKIDVTDTFSNPGHMKLVTESVTVTLNDVLQEDYVYDFPADKSGLSLQIPDETKAVITYQVKIVGEGTVSYQNSASISGEYKTSTDNKQVTIDSAAGGTASLFELRLIKRDAEHHSIKLQGATFQLWHLKNGTYEAVTDKDGNQVTITTGADGTATIKGVNASDGWQLTEGETYQLVEVDAPQNYSKLKEPITFTVKKVATTENEYANGDEILVYNEKKEEKGSLAVTKSVEGDTAPTEATAYEITVTAMDSDADLTGVTATSSVAEKEVQLDKGTAGSVKFSFAAGETVTLNDLPSGFYRVTETKNQDDKFIISYVSEKMEEVEGTSAIKVEPEETSAVTVKNQYPDKANISIGGTKAYEKGLTANQFTFNLKEVNADGTNKADGEIRTAKNNADGSFTFDEISYSEAGTYYYKVSEENGGKTIDGIQYDATVYDVTVTVTDNGSGKLVATADKTASELKFTNKYKTTDGSVSIGGTKVYEKGLTANQFTFNLKEVNADGTNKADGEIRTAKNNADGSFTFDEISYSEAGTYYYKVSEENGGKTIDGIQYDGTVYDVTVTVTDNGKGALIATADKTASELKFTNEYKTTDGSVSIGGTKVYEKGLTANQFTFNLKEVNADGTNKADGEIRTAKNNADGSFTFDEISYSEAGTYYYKVSEENGGRTIDGIQYDAAVYDVTVTVTDNGKGALIATADKTASELKFTNEYKTTETTATVSGTKTLTGKDLEKDQFTFEMKLISVDGKTPASEVKYTAQNEAPDGNKKGAINFPEITYTEAGVYVYDVTETSEGGNGIETDPSVYTVTITIEDNGRGNLEVKSTVITKAETPVTEIEFENEYKTGEASTAVRAKKELTGRNLKADEFEFTLTPVSAVASDGSTPITDSNSKRTIKNTASGSVVFGELKYTAAGTYTYTLKETSEDGNGVTVDTTEYTVKVKVTDNGDGTLTARPEYSLNEKSITETEVIFRNTYETTDAEATVGAKKTLTGRDLKAGEFTFSLTKKSAVGTDGTTTIEDTNENQTGKTNGADGKIAFDKLTYSQAGTYTYELKETSTSGNGVTVDTKVYTVTVTVTDDGNGTLTAATEYFDPAGTEVKSVTFENTYETTDAEATVSAKKTLTGRDLKAGEFTFSLTKKSAVGTDGTTTIEDTNENQTGKTNGADGKIAFDKLTYGQAGTYTYELKETSISGNGVTVDTKVYTVTVTVTDDGNGTLTASTEYSLDGNPVTEAKFENTYAAKGSLVLTAEKKLAGEAKLTDGQFEFTLTGDGITAQTKTNVGETVTFDKLEYDESDIGKTHIYTVKETNKGAKGYTYDSTVYTVTVEIRDNGDGTLNPMVTYKSSKTDGNVQGMVFNNTYTTNGSITLTASKDLEGRTLEEGQFTFRITETDKDGDVLAAGYSDEKQNDAGGTVTFDTISYEKSGTYYYQITETSDDAKGYTYDGSVYKVVVKAADNKAGELKTEIAEIWKDGVKLTENPVVLFENQYTASGSITLQAVKAMETSDVKSGTLGTFEFELKDEEGKVLETVSNDGTGEISFTVLDYDQDDAGKTFRYTVSEKIPAAADQYIYDPAVYKVEVEVADNGDGTLKITAKVDGQDYTDEAMKFVNDTTTVKVKKTDAGNNQPLNGAKLKVVASDGTVVEEWITGVNGETEHVIDAKLTAGETYTLVEESAPEGYLKAEDVTFTVDKDGTVQTVEMLDARTKVQFSKVDADSEEALAGAALKVTDKNGATVEEWISDGSIHEITGKLTAGETYKLVETSAPEGYLTADDIEFTVKTDGTVDLIQMKDARIKNGRISVTKRVTFNGQAIKLDKTFYVALFTDEAGTNRYSGVKALEITGDDASDGTATVVFENLPYGTYYVFETEADGSHFQGLDEGIEVAATVSGGTITLDAEHLTGTATITNDYQDTPPGGFTFVEEPETEETETESETADLPEGNTYTKTTEKSTTAARTGDNTNYMIYIIMLLAAAGCAGGAVYGKKKRKQK